MQRVSSTPSNMRSAIRRIVASCWQQIFVRHSDMDRVTMGQIIMVCLTHLMTRISNKFESIRASVHGPETYLQFLRRGMLRLSDSSCTCSVHGTKNTIAEPCVGYASVTDSSRYYLDRGARLGRWQMAVVALILGKNDRSLWTYDQAEEAMQTLATPSKATAINLTQISKLVKSTDIAKDIRALAQKTLDNKGKLPDKPCQLLPHRGALVCEFIQVMQGDWKLCTPQAPHLFMTCLSRRILSQGGVCLLRQLARETMDSCSPDSNKFQLCERLVSAKTRKVLMLLQLQDPDAPQPSDYTEMMAKLRLTSCVADTSNVSPGWLNDLYQPDSVQIITGVNMVGARSSSVLDLMEIMTLAMFNVPFGTSLHIQLPENASTGLIPMIEPCVTVIHNNKLHFNRGCLEFFGIDQKPCQHCSKLCFGPRCQYCSRATGHVGPWMPRFQFRCECGSLKSWSKICVDVTVKFGPYPAFYLS